MTNKTNEQMIVDLVGQLIELTNTSNKVKREGKELDLMTKWQLNNVWSGLRMINKAIQDKKQIVRGKIKKVA